MRTNAFARNARLYLVWGDPTDPPFIDLHTEPVFVCWSPTLRQWIMSVSSLDRRYDAIVNTWQFVLDSSMLPVDSPTQDAPSYYLNRVRSA